MKYLFLIFILLSNFSLFAQELIPYRKGDKWGFANRQKEVVVEPQFDEVGAFNHYGITRVKVGDKYGYINLKGELITKIEFDKAGDFYFPTANVVKNDSSFCIDFNGKIRSCISGCGNRPEIGSTKFKTYKKNEKIGLLYNDFIRIKKDSFLLIIDSTEAIWDGLVENYLGLAAVSKNGKWGVINEKEELIIDYFYDEISLTPSRQTFPFFITKKDNHYGFINYEGKTIADPIYKKVDYFQYGVAKVWTSDDFWFYIDMEGKEYFE